MIRSDLLFSAGRGFRFRMNRLEEGAAVQENGRWAYTAKSPVPAGQTVVIEATATDHPGHTGVKKVDHACGPRA